VIFANAKASPDGRSEPDGSKWYLSGSALFEFEVIELDGRNIDEVRIRRVEDVA
jgi:CBS domain containing-hemolysin-like protein